jgi:hypothetical protein
MEQKLVWTESDPWLFLLRANKGSVQAAAEKLFTYWSKREEYFHERAFRPINMRSVTETLEQADIDTLRSTDFCLQPVSLTSFSGGSDGQEAAYRINASMIDRCSLRALFYQLHWAYKRTTSVVLFVVVTSQEGTTACVRRLEIFWGHLRNLAVDCLPLKVTRVEIESSPSNPPPLVLLLTLRGIVQKRLMTTVVVKVPSG